MPRLLLLLLPLAAAAQTPLLPADAISCFSLSAPSGAATMSVVPVQNMPFAQALRVATLGASANAWDIRPRCFATQPAAKGDTVLIRFWMRLASGGTDGLGFTSFVVEKGADPYTKSITYTTGVGTEWKQFAVPFTMAESYDGKTSGATSYNVSFWVTFNPQVVEIGGISMLDYGPGVAYGSLPVVNWPYAGHEQDAPWRAVAAERIAKYRKAPIAVSVRDTAGAPVAGAAVRVAMKRHAFRFGSAVAAAMITGATADAQRYRDAVLANFNCVVFENDLKWPQWETLSNRPAVMNSLDWLDANRLTVRGHNLIWPGSSNLPADVRTLVSNQQASQLRQRIDNHIQDEAGALKGRIAEWDVLNEPYTNRDVQAVLGDHEMASWFKLARQADAGAKLYVNDYSITESGGYDFAHQNGYASIIRMLLDDGAPLDGIGLQSHFNLNMTSPERVWQILDRFAAFGRDLEVTEFDINTTDEQLQADYTRDYLTMIFAHPAVKGFLMWGFWQGRHWIPDAAMYRLNWDLKPNGRVWRDLLFRQWWTDVQGATDSEGVFRVPGGGFLGDYEVTVNGAATPLSIAQAGQPGYVLIGRQPASQLSAVTNSASYAAGPVAPGELVTVWGTGLGPAAAPTPDYTRVYFDGVPSQTFYAGAGQVNAIVPKSVSAASVKVEVEYLGTRTAPLTVPVAAAAPGIFTCAGAPQKPVLAQQYLRGALTSCDAAWTPVEKGTIITLFVTGDGGQPVLVNFGSRQAAPDFAGLIYDGVLQINVKLPTDAPSGLVPLTVTAGGVATQAAATISVQ